MAKNGIGRCSWIHHDSISKFKKQALFFSSIYIVNLDKMFAVTKKFEFLPDNREIEDCLRFNVAQAEFLALNGIIKGYNGKYSSNISQETRKLSDERIKLNRSNPRMSREDEERFALEGYDLNLRVDAIGLSHEYDEEFYPILFSDNSFKKGNLKDNIVKIVLEQIPEPDENTPWEQIIDFRSDEDVKNKYYALIKWVNQIAKTNSSPNEIKEEYESLYSDFIKNYKLHKIKYTTTVLEILVNAGLDLVTSLASGYFTGDFSKLVKANLTRINLLQEEAKLPGKEVAYIYKTNEDFRPPGSFC